MKRFLALCVAASCLFAQATAQADASQETETQTASANAAAAVSAADRQPAAAQQQAQTETKKGKAPKERYAQILTDNGYRYDLDTKNLRWIPLPHSGDEYIIDTWVKLTQETADNGSDGTYTYPEKYYLAHYYVRPKTRQIQFLSELEVTGGRPDNTVKGRGYQAQNWEDLTPDSIEDVIYESAVAHVGKNKLGGSSYGNMNIRDAVEEYLRISL